MGGGLKTVKLIALPENTDRVLFVEAMLGRQFMMYHDLQAGRTLLLTDSPEALLALKNALPGIETGLAESKPETGGEMLLIVAVEPKGRSDAIDSLYRLFSGLDSRVVVSFVPASREEVMKAKVKTEEMLSIKEKGFTKSLSTRGDAASETSSSHTDAYYGSEEKTFLLDALDSLGGAMLSNGAAYKIVLFVEPRRGPVLDYLRSKLLILEERRIRCGSIENLYETTKHIEAMPLDSAHASRMLGFSNSIRVNKTISTQAETQGDILFGAYLEGSVNETGRQVGTAASSFNLGTLISGVPGTGKTFAAMHIIKQLANERKLQKAIISPTNEWEKFGRENAFSVIRFYSSRVPFNFFKCDAAINIERFYENLAMLLASASEAGPYTNSLEKCLLAAFRKVYANERSPDPVKVYDEIEEAIIEQHAKRSNVGVKYTKHGENVRAALENLRSMLNRPEFAKKDGVDFTGLLHRGVVFDLSMVSNKMKPFFYALILNQVYSVADTFDSDGDRDLRLLICLEEAQLVLSREQHSAAAADLAQRIQDFRKKGVGVVLVTHNVGEIEPEIRRLCQTKLYFRQSSDAAKYAANDLLFGEKEKELVAERLKELEQRVCALNYIKEENGSKSQAGSVFVKLPEYGFGEVAEESAGVLENPALVKGKMRIRVADQEGRAREGARLQLFYVGEKVHEGKTDAAGCVEVENTVAGNSYRLVLLGEKKKDNKTFGVVGGELNIIKT